MFKINNITVKSLVFHYVIANIGLQRFTMFGKAYFYNFFVPSFS